MSAYTWLSSQRCCAQAPEDTRQSYRGTLEELARQDREKSGDSEVRCLERQEPRNESLDRWPHGTQGSSRSHPTSRVIFQVRLGLDIREENLVGNLLAKVSAVSGDGS